MGTDGGGAVPLGDKIAGWVRALEQKRAEYGQLIELLEGLRAPGLPEHLVAAAVVEVLRVAGLTNSEPGPPEPSKPPVKGPKVPGLGMRGKCAAALAGHFLRTYNEPATIPALVAALGVKRTAVYQTFIRVPTVFEKVPPVTRVGQAYRLKPDAYARLLKGTST